MAKRERDVERVPVIAGTFQRYENRDYLTGEVINMTPQDAADAKALRRVRDPQPGEVQPYARRDMRAKS